MSFAVALADIEKLATGLKAGGTIDWAGALEAVRTHDWATVAVDGYIAGEKAAQIIGILFPPAAVVGSDMERLEPVAKIVIPLVIHLGEHMVPLLEAFDIKGEAPLRASGNPDASAPGGSHDATI